jgi:hypothetical protein
VRVNLNKRFAEIDTIMVNVVYKRVGHTSELVTLLASRTYLIIVYNASTLHL